VEHRFYLLDVFAEGKYTGNQLAVFRNAGHIAADDMRRLAGEVHFSETAFIVSDESRDGGYAMRVFTPTEEIPFSGHAVLGAAYVLQAELLGPSCTEIAVDLPCGRVHVEFRYRYRSVDAVWMKHLPPSYGEDINPDIAASALGLSADDLVRGLPVRPVSTGMPFLMIPVRSREVLSEAHVKPAQYAALTGATGVRSLYVFSRETYEPDNDFCVRMFAPGYGIPEDAATGAGAGCLAAYALDYITPNRERMELSVEQGQEMRRPSLLFTRASRSPEGVQVEVGGRVLMVAQGSFV